MNKIIIVLFGLLLTSCPMRVDPPTESICPSRESCGTCASDVVCAWCPMADATRGCYARSALPTECGIGIRVVDVCPEDDLSFLPGH